MQLLWSSRSPFVRKVMVAAHELGLADRIELTRTAAVMAAVNPELSADNPLNKIPTLILDDGTRLYDSFVICDYLDTMAGGGTLCPPAGPARWRMLGWHALGNGLLDLLIIRRSERDKPADRQTPALLEAFAAKTANTLDHLETLAPALNAEPVGIGQIAIGSALSYLDFRYADLRWRDGREALAAWYADFAARPSMRATEPVDA
jgi:glutathione S-transferase